MTYASEPSTRVDSVDEIRRWFPSLERRQAGRAVAYLDGPGGTQVPRAVVDAVAAYLLHHNANTHWSYATSQETDALIAASRQAVADLLNADPDEVAFGANMTTLTFHLARALGRGFGPGDEVVVTELDHHANIAPWTALARERGITIRAVRMDPETGTLDSDDLTAKINARTRLVAVGAASNALGTINDVEAVVRMARSFGALVFVDAVHYAPHRLIDVRAWDCDFLACSAYKFYGPHVGVLYGKRGLLEGLDVAKLEPAPDRAPERLETGTQNHEGIAGTAAAVDFLAGLADGPHRRARLRSAFNALHGRGTALVEQLWTGLARVPAVALFGPPPQALRTPTVSFVVRGAPAAEVARRLAEEAIYASHGNFYAQTAVERLGHAADGLVRIGCACYTTPEEIDRVVDAVRTAASS